MQPSRVIQVFLLTSGMISGALVMAGYLRNPNPTPPPSEPLETNQTLTAEIPETTNQILDLDWRNLEAKDYRQLMANLRQARCPQDTIDDILFDRIHFEYSSRRLKRVNPLEKYWSTYEQQQAAQAALVQIDQEEDDLLASLGIDRIHTGRPRPQPAQQPASFVDTLSPEKQAQVRRIREQYPDQMLSSYATDEDKKRYFGNRKARIDSLATILSPEELYQYRVQEDSNAKFMARYLKQLNLSDDEFRKVALLMDFSEIRLKNDRLPPDIERQLAEALGPDKFAQCLQIYSPENFKLNGYLMATDLTLDQINQLKDLQSKPLSRDELADTLNKLVGPAKTRLYFSLYNLNLR